ncbi:unnamed protein product [Brassica rapa]|uniref:DUF223 domain-containing protein n=1 Tax=Brassica campestris TaxID=3711 RepID=A0A8D9LW30_BRACM|nr:unnamed protein product [Brassica rapa]
MEPNGNSSGFSDQKTNKKIFTPSATMKPHGKSTAALAIAAKPNGKRAVSSAIPKKQKSDVALSSAHGDRVMFLRDVSRCPHETELRFLLINFWEARNPNTKELIGQELLLIDEEGAVIQGFVPAGRVGMYELTPGAVYKLPGFFGSRSKVTFRVADHSVTVSFSWNSDLSVLDNHPVPILQDRFWFHNYEEFQANCDHRVTFMTITDHTVLDEVDIANKRHLCVHVQTHVYDTIGHTHKFVVKVSDYNLKGKTQTITVTKILPPEVPLAISHLEEGTAQAMSDDVLKSGGEESGPSTGFEHSAGDRVRKSSENLESIEAKHSKSG